MAKRSRPAKLNLPTVKQWESMLLGSDRPGHLFAAAVAGASVAMLGLMVWPWLVQVGGVVVLWEWACTPDVDLADQRSRQKGSILWRLICWLWLPYAAAVGHRSRLSHSLALGLPCRLAYACCWLIIALGLLPLSAIAHHLVTLIAGAAIADAVHLYKDDYTWEEMKWGK